MASGNILLVVADQALRNRLETELGAAGYQVFPAATWREGKARLLPRRVDVILLDATLPGMDGWAEVQQLCAEAPDRPVILIGHAEPEMLLQAWRMGVADFVNGELKALEAVQRALSRRQALHNWRFQAVQRATHPLQQRLNQIETLGKLTQSITAHLQLDKVLQAIVRAAVRLTGAEEGSLLLLDEKSGDLYIRAAQNFDEDFVRTFRLPANDSLAGQVLRTGEPLVLSQPTPHRIKTTYLVRDLVYVPLKGSAGMLGVLSVDNRSRSRPFTHEQVTLLSTLADYAVIALENAHLYDQAEAGRRRLAAVITHLGEGVLVVDNAGRIQVLNDLAASALGLNPQEARGRLAVSLIDYDDIRMLLQSTEEQPQHLECVLAGDHVFDVYTAPIPDVGRLLSFRDITYLKHLDRIKSEFVNTVAHDLRSPLTAILGYVELVERMGNLSERQRDYLERVRVSVHNITNLLNTLLELGRIETGVDFHVGPVPLASVVGYSLDGLRREIERRGHQVFLRIPPDLPPVLGNPIRLRQMFDNLLSNAVRYTPKGGLIAIRAQRQGAQVILQIQDNGIGIPQVDQPFIFEKFYRGSNVPPEEVGIGLGLAIVKSIVEQHQGRIWVESQAGRGSTFFVVLPLAEGGA